MIHKEMWALRALRWILPEHLKDSVLGDLEEEQRSCGGGKFWLFQHCFFIFLHFAWNQAKHGMYWQDSHRNSTHRKGDTFMQSFANNFRFALRMLLKTPLFTAVAAATLALGLGANTAIFSIVNALLIKPLPLPHSEQLVFLAGFNKDGVQQYISWPDFKDLNARTHVFEGFTAIVTQSVNLTGRTEPQRVRGGFVTDNFFQIVGVQPGSGRGFTPSKDDLEGAEGVCIVQYDTLKNVFEGDPSLLGKSIILNNEPFTIIGIMPQTFQFPIDEVEVWIPYHYWPDYQQARADGSLNKRTEGATQPLGRLKSGVTPEQGQTEVTQIFQQLSREYPEGETRTAKLRTFKSILIGDVKQMLLVLLGAVIFVLLIACANVANLMLSRTAVRERELATRAALGAGRKQLMLQLFAEISLLWMIGCIFGLLLGHWALRMLLAAAPEDLPGGITAQLDSTVFVFALVLTATTAIIFGMVPAIRFSSPNVLDALKEGSRSGTGLGRSRLRAALVVGQVALTMILLAGSGLLLRSFQKLTYVDAGFHAEKLLTMEYRLPINKYPDPAQQWQTHHQIIERIRQLPGVQSASLTDGLPFSGNGGDRTTFEIVGRTTPGQSMRGRIMMVEKEYFHTMQIPIYKGRVFRDQDRADTSPVVIINRYIADRYWPNGNPIGAKIKIPDEGRQIVAEVIGIAGNTKHFGLDDSEIDFIYGAQSQTPGTFNTIAVRTIGDPMAMANSVRAAVWSVDPDQPVWKIRTQEFLIDRSLGIPKFLAQLMCCYAALALLLAAIGMYGVISYSVTQQTYEIGVRMALGAQQQDVLRMVLRHGIVLTAAGLFIGVVGALALGRLVQSLLFQTSASDPLTLVIVGGILVSIALIASYLPARRAASVDPLTCLRYE